MRLVAATAERWTHTVAATVLLGEHMLEAEASKRDLGGSSGWGYMCCHMECLLVSYFDPLCFPVLESNPSLREQLDSALLGDQWIGN